MLVLSRKVKERIILPTVQCSITVTAIRSGVVRLGIEAPPGVPVIREELLHRHPPPEDPIEVSGNADKHLLRHLFDCLSQTLQALVQQPRIQSHNLDGMLLHFRDQIDQQLCAVTVADG